MDEDPLILRAVLNEAVLCRVVGGPEVMRRQIRHVIDVLSAIISTMRYAHDRFFLQRKELHRVINIDLTGVAPADRKHRVARLRPV